MLQVLGELIVYLISLIHLAKFYDHIVGVNFLEESRRIINLCTGTN